MNQERDEDQQQMRRLDAAELVGVEGGSIPDGRCGCGPSTEPHDMLKRDYPKLPPIKPL